MPPSFISKHVSHARQAHQPLFATIEVTHKCNFICKHCYNFDREESSQSPYQETLTTEKICTVIEELAEAGSLYLNITGGEPLLHPDLETIVTKAKEQSFFVRLKTNASLLSAQKAKALFESGLDAIDVSLYGASDETYKKFTSKTQYEQVVKGLKNGQEAGLDISVSLILHRLNIHEIEEMIQLCQENQWHFLMSDEITDRYDNTNASHSLSLTDEQYRSLLQSGQDYAQAFACDNQDKEVRCSCAQTVCAVAANGDVYPCIGAPIVSGNILKESFAHIWQHSPELKKIRTLEKSDFKECSTCSLIESCSRSSGSAYINTSDYTACDPEALRRAKIRQGLKRNI